MVETREILLGENDRVRDYLRLVVGDLSDGQMKFGHTAVDDRPIGAIVQHIYGSLSFTAEVVRHGGMANGDRPVPAPPPETREAVLALIDEMHAAVADRWGALDDAQLGRSLTLPWREGSTTGAGALLASIAHAHRHIGNIIDARCLGGFKTRALG